jgi:aryl-alcohol dehydrogenase-like predicted oxidoreductase
MLGTSSVELPVIGFGCGDNARLMIEDDTALQLACIRAALDVGIDYFDTAAAYGSGRSERHLGAALDEIDGEVSVSTKVVLGVEDLADPRGAVLGNFAANLERLGRARVDILMLHNRCFRDPPPGATYAVGAQLSLDQILGPNGVASAFTELIASGLVQTVGFTTFGGEPAATDELIDSGVFGTINASFSLLNPSAALAMSSDWQLPNYAQVIGRAAGAGLGVMAMQVFARGVLGGATPEEGPAGQLITLARELDDRPATVALRYVLGTPGVTTAIVGFSALSHIDDAAAAVAAGPLPSDVRAALEAAALNPR